MVVFSNYAMQVLMAFMMLNMIFILLPRAQVSARRICEVLETENKINDGKETEGKPDMRGCVEFRNVSFRYPGAGGIPCRIFLLLRERAKPLLLSAQPVAERPL